MERNCEKCLHGDKCRHRENFSKSKSKWAADGLLSSVFAKAFTDKLDECMGQVCEGYKTENPLAGKPFSKF